MVRNAEAVSVPGGVHAGRRSKPERPIMKTVDDFQRSRKAGTVGWILMRVIHYRIRYYCGGLDQWTDSLFLALCWEDREQAYAVRANVNGLILIIE